MDQSDIEKALYSQYESFADTYGIETSYPNVPYTPTEGIPYVEITFFHGATRQASVGDEYKIRCRGVMQMDIVTPGGEGDNGASVISGHLHDYFKAGTVCSYNGVKVRIEKFYYGTKSGNNAWYNTPVNVSFRADIEN